MVNEERPKFIRECKDDVTVITVEEILRESMGPDVGMLFATTGTEFTFTTERKGFSFTTMGTDVRGKTRIFGAALKHFLCFVDNIFRKLIMVKLFKESPIVIAFKDRFKSQVSVHNKDDYNR